MPIRNMPSIYCASILWVIPEQRTCWPMMMMPLRLTAPKNSLHFSAMLLRYLCREGRKSTDVRRWICGGPFGAGPLAVRNFKNSPVVMRNTYKNGWVRSRTETGQGLPAGSVLHLEESAFADLSLCGYACLKSIIKGGLDKAGINLIWYVFAQNEDNPRPTLENAFVRVRSLLIFFGALHENSLCMMSVVVPIATASFTEAASYTKTDLVELS